MNCDQIQEHLSEYLDDRLDGGGRRTIEEHLASCPSCLPEVKLLADAVKGVAGLPEMEPPLGFSHRVMARIRKENQKPTLWMRLFQPFAIKIPIHATALLLMIGLTVYLYWVKEPANREAAQSVPSTPAPSFKQAPPPAGETKPVEQRKTEEAPAISSSPLEQFADSKAVAPSETGPPGPSDRADPAPAPPAAPEGLMKSNELKPKGTAAAPSREPAASGEPISPDITLTLSPKEKRGGTTFLTNKVKEAAERRGGKVFALIKDRLPENSRVHFWVSLPKSEYGRLKEELAGIGNFLSEAQSPFDAPLSGRPSPAIRVVVTFLLESSPDTGSPQP